MGLQYEPKKSLYAKREERVAIWRIGRNRGRMSISQEMPFHCDQPTGNSALWNPNCKFSTLILVSIDVPLHG